MQFKKSDPSADPMTPKLLQPYILIAYGPSSAVIELKTLCTALTSKKTVAWRAIIFSRFFRTDILLNLFMDL